MEAAEPSPGETPTAEQATRGNRLFAVAFGVCFFISGCTGLIYENVWMRILGLHFGNTALAVSAVLTAFMAGLALGSYLVGGRADRLRRPLVCYAVIELLIGAFCVLTPYLLHVTRLAYYSALASGESSVAGRTMLQFALCLSVLLIPTALMGATLPILSAGLQRVMGTVSRTVGNLYAINTFGAVAGTLLTAFVLMPWLGVTRTIWLAAALNVAIGLSLLLLTVRRAGERKGNADAAGTTSGERGLSRCGGRAVEWTVPAFRGVQPAVRSFLLRAFFVAGFCALACEVVWTRTLCMVIGSSTYAFAVILTAFLLGIALGSLVFARFWGERRVGIESFGLTESLIGLSCIVLTAGFSWLPDAFLRLCLAFGEGDPTQLLAVQLLAAFILVAPPTLLMGLTFPLVTKVLTDAGGALGSSVGRAYAANTAGAILGSALSSLVLVPLIGLRWTILGAGLLYVLIGAAAFRHAGPEARWAKRYGAAIALAALALVIGLPPWSHSAFAYGVFQSNIVRSERAVSGLAYAREKPDRLVFYQEGPSAVVSVVSYGDSVDERKFALAVNGKVDASTSEGDMVTQVLTGHLPTFLAGLPRRVVLVGLGSGISAASIARHPSVQSVTCVEIEPNVARGARAFFGHLNDNILDPGRDPRFTLAIDDGRSHIERATEPYDVIVSEPSNPWLAGVGNLYTTEFYEQCKSKLSPGGIIVQWVQLYSLDWDTVRMILATFSGVFPNVTVFNTTTTDLLLVGSPAPIVLDKVELQHRLDALPSREDLAGFGLDTPGGITSCFLLSDADLRRACAGAPRNTDDLPLLEFAAPRSLYRECAADNFRHLLDARSSPLPPDEQLAGFALNDPRTLAQFHHHRARSYIRRRDEEQALREIEAAVALDGRNPWILMEHGYILTRADRPEEGLYVLRRAAMLLPDEPEAHYWLSIALEEVGNGSEAAKELEEALALDPGNSTYAEALRDLRSRQD